ncbi:hypothetical protein KSE_59650 [Kitasatospora setae KM-6054]|uniref:Uncharacterized protein n=1 Tax=Kitasatospora setae (strain ATCC 33774 / DSM 43861 / JCM 3304 / KCC A-0304 / NBRC 14216 / KM-6054) TaxID=452652 RepID=E4N0Q1_KITSK|nr:hypothetical protein KSE_59650 [Kitasatospora setae KM-6054]
MGEVAADRSGVLWSGRLGRAVAELREEQDGRRVLRIGDRSAVVDGRTGIRHRTGRLLLSRRVTLTRDGRTVLTHRYRLPWRLQLCLFLDPAYDRWTAEEDDPGLVLVSLLGGTDDWQ